MGAEPGASPAEIARLIQRRALLAPTTTHCAVPAEAARAMGERGMLTMTGYGPSYSFSYTPKPPKALASLAPDWTTRISTRATYVGLLGEGMPGMSDASGDELRPKKKRNVLGLPFKSRLSPRLLPRPRRQQFAQPVRRARHPL